MDKKLPRVRVFFLLSVVSINFSHLLRLLGGKILISFTLTRLMYILLFLNETNGHILCDHFSWCRYKWPKINVTREKIYKAFCVNEIRKIGSVIFSDMVFFCFLLPLFPILFFGSRYQLNKIIRLNGLISHDCPNKYTTAGCTSRTYSFSRHPVSTLADRPYRWWTRKLLDLISSQTCFLLPKLFDVPSVRNVFPVAR